MHHRQILKNMNSEMLKNLGKIWRSQDYNNSRSQKTVNLPILSLCSFSSCQFTFLFASYSFIKINIYPLPCKRTISDIYLSPCVVFVTKALSAVISLTFKIKINKTFLTLCVCTKHFKIQSERRPPWVGL